MTRIDLLRPSIEGAVYKIWPGRKLIDIADADEELLVEELARDEDFIFRALCYVIADVIGDAEARVAP